MAASKKIKLDVIDGRDPLAVQQWEDTYELTVAEAEALMDKYKLSSVDLVALVTEVNAAMRATEDPKSATFGGGTGINTTGCTVNNVCAGCTGP